MKKNLLMFVFGVVLATALLGLHGFQHDAVFAASAIDPAKQQACSGAGLAGTDCNTASTGFTSIVSAVVNILSVIIGIAAVIMVVLSGFKYITSGGDSNKVGSAKSSLTYAIVGLVVAMLAQFIVHFALNTASSALPCPTNSKISATDPACPPAVCPTNAKIVATDPKCKP